LHKTSIFVAKGKIKNHFHDLLIYPTVWQFFKNKKSIFIAKAETVERAMKMLSGIYGGKWKISERIINYSKSDILKFKEIIKKNINRYFQ